MEIVVSSSPERIFRVPGIDFRPIFITSEGDPSPKNGALNYARCLSYSDEDCLVVEDDIVFAEGWYDYLCKTVESISELHPCFVLSLYTVLPLDLSIDKRYVEYPEGRFGGTQAVYYSKYARLKVGEFMRNNCLREGFRIWDWEIRDYLERSEIPIFVTVPNLVQHVGGSLIGSPLHTSPNFVDRVD